MNEEGFFIITTDCENPLILGTTKTYFRAKKIKNELKNKFKELIIVKYEEVNLWTIIISKTKPSCY